MSFGFYSGFLNRTACDVLEELRKCNETRNFAPVLGLLEELQSMVNRMEAKLSDSKDWQRSREDLKRLQAEVKKLVEKKKELGGDED